MELSAHTSARSSHVLGRRASELGAPALSRQVIPFALVPSTRPLDASTQHGRALQQHVSCFPQLTPMIMHPCLPICSHPCRLSVYPCSLIRNGRLLHYTSGYALSFDQSWQTVHRSSVPRPQAHRTRPHLYIISCAVLFQWPLSRCHHPPKHHRSSSLFHSLYSRSF